MCLAGTFILIIFISISGTIIAVHVAPALEPIPVLLKSIDSASHLQEDPNCNRTQQWPVNLDFDKDSVIDEVIVLNFTGSDYCTQNKFRLHIDGRTVRGEFLRSNMAIKVSNDTYKLSHFHFHWRLHKLGSFHTISGESYPLEMHLVHVKEQATKENEASESELPERELLIIAVLVDAIQEGNYTSAHDDKSDPESRPTEFQPITESLPCINKSSSGAISETLLASHLNLIDLYPQNGEAFSYKGSLTVRNCNEHIRWIVYKDPIRVYKSQIEAFRNIINAKSRRMVWNQFENSDPVPILKGATMSNSVTKIICGFK